MKYTFKDICTKIGSGATPTGGKEAYKGGDYALVRSQNVLDYTFTTSGLAYINETQAKKLDGVKVESGDVLLNITGDSVARACIIPDKILPARVNQHVAIIRANNQYALNEYLLYFLQYNKQYLLSISQGGGTRSAITKKMIEDIEIDLPSIEDQLTIVNIINSISKKIEVNQQINDNLEQQAQALYKSWFVDFEPFKDGEFIESEIGLIPFGWKTGKIKDIINLLSGFPFKSSNFVEHGEYQLITIKGVQDGYLDVTSADKLSDLPSKMPDYCILKIGDILISLTGNVGRVCIVDRKDLLLNQRVAIVSPKNKRDSFYTYTMFRNETFKNELIHLARGTAQLNLSPVETADKLTIIPPDSILEAFAKIGQDIFKQYVSIKMENIRLCEMRDSLLPKLMSGELEINNLDC